MVNVINTQKFIGHTWELTPAQITLPLVRTQHVESDPAARWMIGSAGKLKVDVRGARVPVAVVAAVLLNN
jgi:hypothetical protein